jgi:fatty-acyl-CoA synthase
VSVINGIPTHFIMMLDHPDLASRDLTSARTGWIGGAMIPAEVVMAVRERMRLPLLAVYGMTETTSVTTFTRPEDPVELICSTVGIKISNDYEVGIFDPSSGARLPAKADGEIWVRGPLVMKGYYRDPAATDAVIRPDGWFRTGDIGALREDGYLQITGRLKDMYISGGANVYPAEIEAAIYEVPGVKQAYVIGVPDYRLGEVGMAFIEVVSDARLDADTVMRHCKHRLAGFKLPRDIRFVDEFPMTGSGKVQKYKLRESAIAELQLEDLAKRRLLGMRNE